MSRVMAFRWVAAAGAALMATACAPIARPAGVEVEISALPENQEAVRLGVFKTTVVDRGKGNAELSFVVGGQRFTGQMQVIDNSQTTQSRNQTSRQTTGAAVTTAGAGVSQVRSTGQTSGSQTVTQGSSQGVANAVSDRGVTLSCEYTVNNRQLSGAGSCAMSNGAQYRMYAKPLRVLMSDGSSRPI